MTSSDRDAAEKYANEIIAETEYDSDYNTHPYWSDAKTEEMVSEAYLAGCQHKQEQLAEDAALSTPAAMQAKILQQANNNADYIMEWRKVKAELEALKGDTNENI